MNQKILASVATILVVATIAGGITYAYWERTRTSSGNTFSMTRIDLLLADGDNDFTTENVVFATHNDMYPGLEVGPFKLQVKNGKPIPGKVKVEMSYSGIGDATIDNIAKEMVITNAKLDGAALDRQAYWAKRILEDTGLSEADGISQGYIQRLAPGDIVVDGVAMPNLAPTLFGLSTITIYYRNYNGSDELVWNQDDVHETELMVQLDGDAPDTLQDASIEAIASVTIHQANDPGIAGGVNW